MFVQLVAEVFAVVVVVVAAAAVNVVAAVAVIVIVVAVAATSVFIFPGRSEEHFHRQTLFNKRISFLVQLLSHYPSWELKRKTSSCLIG